MISKIPAVFKTKSMTNHKVSPLFPECHRASPFQKRLHNAKSTSAGTPKAKL